MIAVYDYGAGNLQSVCNALARLGAHHRVVRDAEGLQAAEKIILPGVGHFGHMMRALSQAGVQAALLERIRSGIPFLGICLGLHALFAGSEEEPGTQGFGLFPEAVRRLPAGVRVPHMGWNVLEVQRPSRLLSGLPAQVFVYFAHSYYAPVTTATTAVCHYGATFTALLERDNVFGVQFHPEKSGPLGLRILENFLKL